MKEEKMSKLGFAALATLGVLATSLVSMTIHELKVIRKLTRDQDEAEENNKPERIAE